MGAKWTLTTPASGGDVAEDILEARVSRVFVDYTNNTVIGYLAYGKEDGEGNFVISPLTPPGGITQLEGLFEAHADLNVAWENFERKLFQRANEGGFLPDGSDGS